MSYLGVGLGAGADTGIDLSGIRESIVNGVTNVTGEMTATVTDMLPAILVVVGTVTLVFFGIKLFKKFTAKA